MSFLVSAGWENPILVRLVMAAKACSLRARTLADEKISWKSGVSGQHVYIYLSPADLGGQQAENKNGPRKKA